MKRVVNKNEKKNKVKEKSVFSLNKLQVVVTWAF